MGARPNLDDPLVYHDSTLNPTNAEPEHLLRIAYKRAGLHGRVNMSVLQALCDAGYTTSQTFATSFGSDRDKAEERFRSLPEIRDNLSNRDGEARAEVGFLLTVWEELYGRHKARVELSNKNANQAEPVILTVSKEKQQLCKNKYKNSRHQQYFPLVPTTTPHIHFWNQAYTMLTQIGTMPFYPVEECRYSTEAVGKGSQLSVNMSNLIEVGQKVELSYGLGLITVSAEIMLRRWVYWTLAYFLDECELEHSIAWRNSMEEWLRKRNPPASAIKHADDAALREVTEGVQENRYATFQEGVIAVTTKLKTYQDDAMLYATGPSRGTVEEARDAHVDYGALKPTGTEVGPDGNALWDQYLGGWTGNADPSKSKGKGK